MDNELPNGKIVPPRDLQDQWLRDAQKYVDNILGQENGELLFATRFGITAVLMEFMARGYYWDKTHPLK